MKKLLFTISILFITISVLSHGVTTSKITSIITLVRNSKSIFFFKHASNSNASFLLKAMNESSKDFT